MNALLSLSPEPGSMYIKLNDEIYPSGSSILITDVSTAISAFNPGSSLVCVTSEVNSQCCRGRDRGNVGEWLHPDGSLVPRRNQDRGADFTRSGFKEEVRLNRRNSAIGPSGVYTCSVPSEPGCGDEVHNTLYCQRNSR